MAAIYVHDPVRVDGHMAGGEEETPYGVIAFRQARKGSVQVFGPDKVTVTNDAHWLHGGIFFQSLDDLRAFAEAATRLVDEWQAETPSVQSS